MDNMEKWKRGKKRRLPHPPPPSSICYNTGLWQETRFCSFIGAEVCCVVLFFFFKPWSVSFQSSLQQSGSNQLKAWMEKTLCNCKRQKTLPTLRPCGRSQSLTSPFSGSLENTVFLWPLAKNSLCQISANNSGISFPCLWSVGVLESLACVGRDSLAKIKTVLQSCIREKES